MATPVMDLAVEGRTLTSLLELTREDLAAGLNSDALVAAGKDQKAAMDAWMQRADAKTLRLQIADHVCDALKVSLVNVFAGAWAKYYELRKCARETRDDPASTTAVALARIACANGSLPRSLPRSPGSARAGERSRISILCLN